MNKLTPLVTSLVDAPPPRKTEGEKRPVKGERGELQRPEGEGGQRRERASGGAALGQAARWGTRGVVRGGRRERSGVGRGDFFSSLLVGPRITNPIRTFPPG